MDMGINGWISSPSSSTSGHELGEAVPVWSQAAKRPAGRTKFKETRHPVYRGVRRRGSAGRWVCEVRVPGKRGERLWLGTYVAAESAARAHDAAMLALLGRSPSAAACLNFPDSAWLLVMPPRLSDLADVRRAAIQAVVGFLRLEAATVVPDVDEATSPVYLPSPVDNADQVFQVPTFSPLGSDMFELDMSGEMDLDAYYAGFAQGMLLEPPPTPSYWENGECGDGGAAAGLWSY
ncbi:dehydration-responsive element-binding protein 1H-like [Aegilops tauschii subsp. strangulata]|uniref:AP2/ERF domain-containing protein n=1 Tax=Aegilops tauschii subsp. strangulata TaxID=200361 RepID=A0A453LD39_AEGTS|nr:dehydration-responsive element-binding protein 1H-like [Aegilops tauschii subsp. strangulata]